MTKIAEPYRCSNTACGKAREKDANHWWLVEFYESDHEPVIAIRPWDAEDAKKKDVEHVCGIDCALKIASGIMAKIVEGIRNHGGADGDDHKS